NRLRLFDLKIDGVTVKANVGGGSSAPQRVSPGKHVVSEALSRYTVDAPISTVIAGDCDENGIVNLALGDNKVCTITNYDNAGGCRGAAICCEPGDGMQGCLQCGRPGRQCP